MSSRVGLIHPSNGKIFSGLSVIHTQSLASPWLGYMRVRYYDEKRVLIGNEIGTRYEGTNDQNLG
jgi:hypothetical protein